MLTYQATKSSKSFIRAEPKWTAPSTPASWPINPSPLSHYWTVPAVSLTQRLSPFSPLFQSHSFLCSLTFVPCALPATPPPSGHQWSHSYDAWHTPWARQVAVQLTVVLWEDPAMYPNGSSVSPTDFSFPSWQTVRPKALRPPFIPAPTAGSSVRGQHRKHAWSTLKFTCPNHPTRVIPSVSQVERSPQDIECSVGIAIKFFLSPKHPISN